MDCSVIIENLNGLTVLYAEGNNKITNSERSLFTDMIYLGKNDSVENYKEVCKDIWKNYIKEEQTVLNVLSEKINNVDNKIEENNSSILLLEELLLDTHYKLMCLQLNLEYGLE